MADHFVKIYASILDSSIWLEPAPTRLVWITLLAMADEFGVVRASVGGLAHRARVDKAECEAAIETLLSPDPDSGSSDYEGRRIAVIDGGWEVLNALKYREKRSKRQIQNAEAAERRRARERADQEMEAPDPEEAKPAKKTKPAKKAAAPDSEVEWRVAATWTSFLAARAEFYQRVDGRKPSRAPSLTAEIRASIVDALRQHDAGMLTAETRDLWVEESIVLAAGEGLWLDPWCTGQDARSTTRYVEPWRPWRQQRGKGDPVAKFAELAFARRGATPKRAPSREGILLGRLIAAETSGFDVADLRARYEHVWDTPGLIDQLEAALAERTKEIA